MAVVKRVVVWLVLTVLAALTWGCGGAGGSGGRGSAAVFPSRERLQEITSQPPPTRKQAGGATVSVDSWELGSLEATSQNTLLEGNDRPSLRTSPALGCAARELGRFVAQKGGAADQQLQNHVFGQCGVTTIENSLQYWTTELSGPASDQELLAQVRPALRKYLAALPTHPTDVGSAFVREPGRAVFMLITSRRLADLEPIQQPAEDGTVVLSGKLLTGADALHGMITQGEFGVGQCAFDRSLRLPRFRLTCHLAPDDQSAWIELRLRPTDRLLLRGVARYRVKRNAAAELFSVPVLEAASQSPGASKDYRQSLLGAINGVRAKAGLGALQLATAQSREHEKLAPYFFAGAEDDAFMDDIALGLMAGWEVPGMIRDGSFFGAALNGTVSVDRWLAHLLESPAARSILLDAHARVLALGPLVDEKTASVGALFSTYSFYETANHDQERQRLIDRIARQRQARGAAAAHATQDPELGTAAGAVRGGKDPEVALNDALSVISNRDRKSVQGMLLETLSLDDLVLPPELATRPRLEYAIEVTHARRPGAAWATLVVMIIISEPTTTTASSEPVVRIRRG